MKTMIVVDDEYLVRLGIRETIDWEAKGFRIVGEAANGRAGLELIEKLRPDIVLSDIKMPLMDGVELVKAVQAKALDLAVVILSGFKDFDFAKGALEHGATEYLLKPIDNDELVAAVARAAVRLDAIRARDRKAAVMDAELPAVRKALYETLVAGPVGPEFDARLTAVGIAIPAVGRIVYGTIDAAETYVDRPAAQSALGALAAQVSVYAGATALFVFETDFFAAVAAGEDDEVWEGRLRSALTRFEKGFADIVSLAVSAPYDGLAAIPAAFAAARTAAKNKFFPALSTVAVPGGDATPWKPLVVKAMELIARDYAQNLTVKAVTDALYVSESYLLHTFKKDTGVTFNACLTNYRILTAKRLLLQHAYKVYEIAGMVGYADQKYFSSVFKKCVGMTPSEYAERSGGAPR